MYMLLDDGVWCQCSGFSLSLYLQYIFVMLADAILYSRLFYMQNAYGSICLSMQTNEYDTFQLRNIQKKNQYTQTHFNGSRISNESP